MKWQSWPKSCGSWKRQVRSGDPVIHSTAAQVIEYLILLYRSVTLVWRGLTGVVVVLLVVQMACHERELVIRHIIRHIICKHQLQTSLCIVEVVHV